jgi:protein-S-isoprenylcysteine O-methyltransferase Ste14
MNFFQQLSIGWTNGWWFSALFMSVNISMIVSCPKHFKVRVLKQPDFASIFQKACSTVSFILFQGNIWYSMFIPMQFHFIGFYAGIILFITGMFGYIKAMLDYATTPPNEPVTKGIYTITRNPQQLMSMLLWTGAGIALGSWLIVIVCVLQLILSYPGFTAQEQTCLKKYGEPYKEYLSRTKRYF